MNTRLTNSQIPMFQTLLHSLPIHLMSDVMLRFIQMQILFQSSARTSDLYSSDHEIIFANFSTDTLFNVPLLSLKQNDITRTTVGFI